MYFDNLLYKVYTRTKSIFFNFGLYSEKLPIYFENTQQNASDYFEVENALSGVTLHAIRTSKENYIVSVAVPIQSFKTIQGALLLSTNNERVRV